MIENTDGGPVSSGRTPEREQLSARLNKYVDDVAGIFDRPELKSGKGADARWPAHITPMLDMNMPDGSPIKVQYFYYPEGMEHFPSLVITTITEQEIGDIGTLRTDYTLHFTDIDGYVWEKYEKLILKPDVFAETENAPVDVRSVGSDAGLVVTYEARYLDNDNKAAILEGYMAGLLCLQCSTPSLEEVANLQHLINQLNA